MFKPASRTRDILSGVAIHGQVAALSFNVVLSDVEKTYVAKALVTLSRTIADKNLDAFMQGLRRIVPKVLALNGKAGWISTISTSSCHDNRTSILWRPALLECPRPPVQNAVFLTCPNKFCDKVESSTCRDFQFHDLDAKHKCFHCHKLSGVRNWNCPCGVRWHVCQLHAVVVGSLTISPRSQVLAKWQASSSGGQKRKQAEASSKGYGELLAEDLRREGKRGRHDPARTITLGDAALPSQAPSRLGLELRRRLGI